MNHMKKTTSSLQQKTTGFVGNTNTKFEEHHKYTDAHGECLVTSRGTGVKSKPMLSDITSATALKEETPSGTVTFQLAPVSSLREMTATLDLIGRFFLNVWM